MDLHKGNLYWPETFKAPSRKKPAEMADSYDAVIVGAGMSGALTALSLLDRGLRVAVLDKRKFGTGSTAANTGLLQYTNDIMLHELIAQIGEEDAVAFYRSCLEAMGKLKKVAERLPVDSHFLCRDSIYYSSDERDAGRLKKEYETLAAYGFPCAFWDREELKEHTGIDKPCAILTSGDAEVNPYKFVNGIFNEAENLGADLFEATELFDAERGRDGKLTVSTSAGEMKAANIIFTTGYETLPVGRRVGADINRSYVMVSKPLEETPACYGDVLIWETKRPYLYMRTTPDRRVIVGGLDEDSGRMEITEERICEQAEKLRRQFEAVLPDVKIETDYAYCATFGESVDNLPFIGEHPEKPGHYYLLGYGGNGTVYSMIGAEILGDLLFGKGHPAAHIVQLVREGKKGGRMIS